MLHFVYELIDPRTNVAAYVGITDNPNRRLQEHLSDTKTNDEKRIWIEQLLTEHLEPRMRILEIVETKEDALIREQHWIRQYLQQGVVLTNLKRYTTSTQLRPAALAKVNEEKGKKVPKFVYSPSTPNDLWAEVKIGTQLYGEDDIVPFKKLLEWREINDEMFMSLKENGKVIAYSSLMPLEEEVILSLLEDKIRERDIPDNAIRQWTDPQLSVYVASVTANPTGNKEVDTRRGWMIIRHSLKWALSLDRQFTIVNWYGIGATKEGQALFENLGFSNIVSLYNGERKGYKIRGIKQLNNYING